MKGKWINVLKCCLIRMLDWKMEEWFPSSTAFTMVSDVGSYGESRKIGMIENGIMESDEDK